MAGTVRHAKGLETRTGRMKLKPGRQAHWRSIIAGRLALGYQRQVPGKAGRWVARSYVAPGKYQVTPLGAADDYAEADGRAVLTFEDACTAVRALHRTADGRATNGTTVADAMADYIAWLRIHRATADDAERRARKLILPALGKVKLSELTSDRIRNWLHRVAERPALLRTGLGAEQNFKPLPDTAEGRRGRRATANRTLTILKAALNKAWENEQVADRTAWQKVKPFEQVNAVRPDYLTIPEATRLINAADAASGFRDLVHGALLTGCRYGELCALRARDYQRGKLHIARSKSGKARDVVLTEEGRAFFEYLTAGRAPGAPSFLRYGEPWVKSNQARHMRAACVAANIKPVGFHQLRHTYASHAVMNGMPLPVLAHNLGHATTMMIQRHYGHLAKSYIDEMIRQHAPVFGVPVVTNLIPLRVEQKAQSSTSSK